MNVTIIAMSHHQLNVSLQHSSFIHFMWKVRLDLKWGYRCSIVYSCVVTGEKEFRVVGKQLSSVLFTLSI